MALLLTWKVPEPAACCGQKCAGSRDTGVPRFLLPHAGRLLQPLTHHLHCKPQLQSQSLCATRCNRAASPATLLQRAANNIRNLSSACSLPAEALKAELRAGVGAGDTCNGEHRKLKEIMKPWPRKNLSNEEVATNPKGHLLLCDLRGNSLT